MRQIRKARLPGRLTKDTNRYYPNLARKIQLEREFFSREHAPGAKAKPAPEDQPARARMAMKTSFKMITKTKRLLRTCSTGKSLETIFTIISLIDPTYNLPRSRQLFASSRQASVLHDIYCSLHPIQQTAKSRLYNHLAHFFILCTLTIA